MFAPHVKFSRKAHCAKIFTPWNFITRTFYNAEISQYTVHPSSWLCKAWVRLLVCLFLSVNSLTHSLCFLALCTYKSSFMPPLIPAHDSVPFSCDKHTSWSDYLYAYIHGTCVLWVPTTLITFQPVEWLLPHLCTDTNLQQWSSSCKDRNLYNRDTIPNILYLENLHYCSVTSFIVLNCYWYAT